MFSLTRSRHVVSKLGVAVVALAIGGCSAFAGTPGRQASGDDTSGENGANGMSKGSSTANPAGMSQPSMTGSNPGQMESAACQAQRTALAAALEIAREDNAALAVQTPACGKQIIVGSDDGSLKDTDLHRIGGVTKTFVSYVILSLVNDGRLGLEDAASSYVPSVVYSAYASGDGSGNANGATTPITVRQLLNHTSGLHDYSTDDAFWTMGKPSWTPAEIVAFALSRSFYFAPGMGWHQSDTNYIVLGMIAETVTGESIAHLIHTRALAPANLGATFFAGADSIPGTIAKGVDLSDDDVTNTDDPSTRWAAAALVASPSDLLDWTTSLYGGPLLDPTEKSTLIDNGGSPTGHSGVKCGLGVFEYDASLAPKMGSSLGHASAISGYGTQISYFPDKQITIVAIADGDATDPNDITVGALGVLAP